MHNFTQLTGQAKATSDFQCLQQHAAISFYASVNAIGQLLYVFLCKMRLPRLLLQLAGVIVALHAPAVLAARSVSIDEVAGERPSGPTVDTEGSIVCFVVRTYWGHGDTWGDKSLRRILASLQNQTVGR